MPTRPIKSQGTTQTQTIMPPVRSRTRPAALGQGNTEASEISDPQQAEEEAGYAVGYGKPPVSTRFKSGHSGNPKGRPKAAKGLGTIVRDTMTQKVAVRTPSGEKRISRIEAALHKTVELAMKGNPRALAQLIKLYADAVPETKSSAGEQVLTEDLTATDLAMLDELRQILLAGKVQAR
jgi:hypothetical protein